MLAERCRKRVLSPSIDPFSDLYETNNLPLSLSRFHCSLLFYVVPSFSQLIGDKISAEEAADGCASCGVAEVDDSILKTAPPVLLNLFDIAALSVEINDPVAMQQIV